MEETLLALAVGAAAGLVPLINIEVYLLGAAVFGDDALRIAVALAAAAGQTLGKIAFYYAGMGVLNVRWLKRKAERPPGRWAERAGRWRRRAEEQPWWGAGLLALSSLVSIPPLMAVCVLAGAVRMRLSVFASVTMATRSARFLVLVYAPGAVAAVSGAPWPGG
ncbi:hypothetical protein J0910_09055 [Nocardiopsis sp. CNT-189]|uniref:hypothetical protein n=1 Tax=Nocardiopsis oceanisediminis TaxID=2816862 RepID=UPI003B300063